MHPLLFHAASDDADCSFFAASCRCRAAIDTADAISPLCYIYAMPALCR